MPAVPVALSAHSPGALRAQAADLHALLTAGPDLPVLDLAHSLATTRPALARRAALTGGDRTRLADELLALSEGRSVVPGPASTASALPAADPTDGIAFVFPGHGPRWLGTADELLAASPVFAEHLPACADARTPTWTGPCSTSCAAPRTHPPSTGRTWGNPRSG